MTALDFAGEVKRSPIYDLLIWNKETVPTVPGAYVLMAHSEAMFRYPGGQSPVFYIGEGNNLQERLGRHRSGILQVKGDHRHVDRLVARHYGATFGAWYSFIQLQDVPPASAGFGTKQLEDLLLEKFAIVYRSLPVANSGWDRIRKRLKEKTPI
jgi:hypothetical protein